MDPCGTLVRVICAAASKDTFCLSVVVRVDTFVDKDDSHIELCRALRVSQLTDSGFKVTVHHLDLSSMAIARVIVLLEQINQQVGLSVSRH